MPRYYIKKDIKTESAAEVISFLRIKYIFKVENCAELKDCVRLTIAFYFKLEVAIIVYACM